MKKKLFDGGLYREGLRQLRGMGIVMLILFVLAAVLIPVGIVISTSNEIVVDEAYGAGVISFRAIQAEYLEINLPILCTFTIAAPLLALKLFHFLDRREASDFYHSITQTRTCLFVSFFAALVSWIAILVIMPAAVSVVLCTIFSRYLELSLASVFMYSWHLLAAGLLVAAAVVLAMSLTGTVFTNMAVAAVILFLPRLVVTVILTSVDRILPYVAEASQSGLLDYRMNIISGTVFGVFLGDPLSALQATRSGIYTLVLAALYALLGCYYFRRRCSEGAGQAAVSRRMQLVIRLMVSLVICLIPSMELFSKLRQGEAMSGSELFLTVVFYLIAILTYLLYELIATKKWGNLLKSLPGLGVLTVLNVVLIFGMYVYSEYQSAIRPEAGEISYTRMLPDSGNTYWFVTDSYGGANLQDYFRAQEAEVKIKDPEVLQLVSERLGETIDYYESNGSGKNFQNYQFRTVAICTGIRTIYRNIWLKDSDVEAIGNVLQQDERVRERYQQLPAPEDYGENMELLGSLSHDCMKEVYDTLRQEVASMDFEEWYVILSQSTEYVNDPMLCFILKEEDQNYQLMLHLTEDLPRTLACFYEQAILHEDSETREEALTALADPSISITELWIERLDQGQSWWATEAVWKGEPVIVNGAGEESADFTTMREEPRKALLTALETSKDRVPEPGEACCQVMIEWRETQGEETQGDYEWYSYSGYFSFANGVLPEEIAEELGMAEAIE